MYTVSSRFKHALSYSQTPLDEVEIWRGGIKLKSATDFSVLSGNIKVSGGQGQLVRSSANLTLADNNGKMIPYNLDDPLAPFGSEFRIKMGLKIGRDSEMLDQGYFPITSTEIDPQWVPVIRPAEPNTTIWRCKGATYTVEALDRSIYIERNKFIKREQPPASSTVFSEAARLLEDRQPPYGGIIGSISDRGIPSDFTYDLDRLKALLDLANLLDVDCLVDYTGVFKFISRAVTAPVWRLAAGDFAVIRKTHRKITADGVYNGAVEKGNTADDQPLQAIRVLGSGPLAWGGPYGRNALQHASPLLQSQDAVELGVETVMTRAMQITPQQIPIECVRNPALQWGDYIELPTRTGYISAKVIDMNLPLGVNMMTLTVSADPFLLGGLL